MTPAEVKTALTTAAVEAICYDSGISEWEAREVAAPVIDAVLERLGRRDIVLMIHEVFRVTPTPPKPGLNATYTGPMTDAILVGLGATLERPWGEE